MHGLGLGRRREGNAGDLPDGPRDRGARGVAALMGSCNRVNGTCAHENTHLLTGILRSEWGVDGMAVSDWGGSNSAVDAART